MEFKTLAHRNSNICVICSYVQRDRLVPHWIQTRLDGLGLLLNAVGIRNQLQLHVRIAQAVRIHWNKIPALFDCNKPHGISDTSMIA